MDAINVLEDVLIKTVKNTSIENRARAVEALQKLLIESNDAGRVSEYLIKLHYSVIQAFFEEITISMDDEAILSIVKSLISNEQFLNGNPTNIMYPKGFVSALSLAQKQKYHAAFIVLNTILAQKSISDGCRNGFTKFVVDKEGLPAIRKLIEQINSGALMCSKEEQQRLSTFIETYDGQGKNEKITSIVSPLNRETDSGVAEHKPVTSERQVSQELNHSLRSIEDAQREILAKIRNITENRSSIDILTTTLARKENELASVRSLLAEKESQIEDLHIELKNRDQNILITEDKVSDLTERLRNALNMEDISSSQELSKLKNDISEALKLDYSDFQNYRESSYSIDLFEAYRSTLSRIFKLLRRFGISCE